MISNLRPLLNPPHMGSAKLALFERGFCRISSSLDISWHFAKLPAHSRHFRENNVAVSLGPARRKDCRQRRRSGYGLSQASESDSADARSDSTQKSSQTPVSVDAGTSSPSLKTETFSRLPSSLPWDRASMGVTMAAYLGVLHGPLGLGGLTLVANLSHQPVLDPQIKAVSLVILQSLELVGARWLVQSILPPSETFPDDIFKLQISNVWKDRGWLPTSSTALLLLFCAIGATSSLSPHTVNPEGLERSSALGELLMASPLSLLSTFCVSCLITPYLEEYIYRGFLLTSLATFLPWPVAIVLSSGIFMLAHLPVAAGIHTLSLLMIGCLLGLSYMYTGNLATSFVIHSIYNAAILLLLSRN